MSTCIALAIIVPGSFSCCEPYVPNVGGRLVLADSDFYSTSNPFLLDGAGTISMMARVYEPLVQIRLDGTFVPCLAESWDTDVENETYTFHIRQNAYWHDSTDEVPRPVTADDVVFTFETNRDLLTEAGVEFWEYAESVTALDTYTVQIAVDEMTIDFFEYCSNFFIAPKHIWDGMTVEEINLEENLEPIGSGPFLFDQYEIQSFLRLLKNDNWWGDGPYINEIVIEYYADAEVAVPALLAGDLDANNISSTYVDVVMGQPGVTIEFNYNSPNEMILFVNHRSTAMDIKEVRQAVNLAIDMEERIEYVHNGYATMPYPVPWVPEQYRSDDFVWAGAGMTEEERIAEANALLDAIPGMSTIAGGINGIRTYNDDKLSFNCQHGQAIGIVQGAEMMRDYMKEIGIELTLEIAGKRTMIANVGGGPENWDNWDWCMVGFGAKPTLGSIIKRYGDDPFDEEYRSTAIGWPHKFETVDDIPEDPSTLVPHPIQVLLRQVRRTLDDEERYDLFYEVQELWVEELPCIVLPDTIGVNAFRTEFTDWNAIEVFEGMGYSSPIMSNSNLTSVKAVEE